MHLRLAFFGGTGLFDFFEAIDDVLELFEGELVDVTGVAGIGEVGDELLGVVAGLEDLLAQELLLLFFLGLHEVGCDELNGL